MKTSRQINHPKIHILLSVFIALLIGMNLLGGKLFTFFGVTLSVGIFMVPITFLITDIVEEVYGKKVAKDFIVGGVTSLILVFIFTAIFVALPPAERFANNEAYKTLFGSSLRMIIASIIAFSLSQTHDVIAFEWWKKKTHGKALWLRNNLSTMASQLIDTFIFMMIAFYKLTPMFTFKFVISMAIPYFIFKIIFALIDTPFVYAGVKWLKKDL